jgi:hypothetical protein
MADHVVGEDERSGAREFEGQVEVLDVTRLLSVEEDEVEECGGGADEVAERLGGGADAEVECGG